MLIDIFARRYDGVQLRDSFEERDRRLLVQGFRILSEDMYRYYDLTGKESSTGVAFWTGLHARLSRELGLKELSPQWFSYPTQWQGKTSTQTAKHPLVRVCENWMLAPVAESPDQHIKERLSLIELGFRQREGEVAAMNAQPIITRQPRPAPMVDSGVQRLPQPSRVLFEGSDPCLVSSSQSKTGTHIRRATATAWRIRCWEIERLRDARHPEIAPSRLCV